MLIRARIDGVSPLLCNRFTEAEQMRSESAIRVSSRGEKGTPREQAEPKLYKDSAGRPVVPGPNLFAAIVAAGAFVKTGKSKLTTMKSSLVPAGMAIVELELPLSPVEWECDSRPVVIPSTGGRVMAHRPRFDKWSLGFSIEVDEDLFSERIARELVDIAGKRIGLGDFRPARRGPFGRFVATSWKVAGK